MPREHILMTGVEPKYAAALRRLGERLRVDCIVAGEDSDTSFRERPPSLYVIGIDGSKHTDPSDRIRRVTKARRGVPVAVLARGLATDAIVRIVRDGAADVIGLPADPAEVAARALAPVDAAFHTGSGSFVSLAPAMRTVREDIEASARTGSTVLLTGETGTGKGVIARTIHERSGRSGELVHIDCASLNQTLIESELFGHERGAFTGAASRRVGRFEQAAGGTVFLDEIAELSPSLQAKMLRVLQDRCFERVGGTQTLHMNARVIAATNRDLHREMVRGRFRADLFYRLSVIEIAVPPLRERIEDLPLLVQAGLQEVATRLGRPVPHVASDLLGELARFEWPGNVRQLMNELERLLVRCDRRTLAAADLPPSWRAEASSRESPGPVLDERLEPPDVRLPQLSDEERQERARIHEVMRLTAGNVSRAARRLGITRSRLRYRLGKYDLMHLIPND